MSTTIRFSWAFALIRLRLNRASLSGVLITCCILVCLAGCSPKALKTTASSQDAEIKHNNLMLGSPAVKLEIHHININNGDATAIRIIHEDLTETKVLIDGGQASPATYLLPYCNAMFKDNQFKFIILSHYHNDHYNGLTALKDGSIRGEYYVDLGGYNIRGFVADSALARIQPRDTTCPWTDSIGIFDGVTMVDYVKAVGKATEKFGLKRYGPMTTTTDQINSLIGVVIPLDTFLSGGKKVPISLRCVAAWGFTQGNNAVVDNWNRGASKNDPSLGFVLECGQFRYFLGGDMGGQASGSYIDQETTLATGFQYLYRGAKSYYKPAAGYDGHVCGFKANHHGSDHSNNSTFLNTMRPAVCVTSAGDNDGWHLPSVGFLNRLNATTGVTPLADTPINPSPPPFVKMQGFFFTNLKNFSGGNNSLTVANNLFGTRLKTGYQYGSAAGNRKTGYQVIVALNNSLIDFTKKSTFGVVSVDTAYKPSPYITVIGCHQL
jgi:beta-lactamase superfamily II metal-dependent hydrolase